MPANDEMSLGWPFLIWQQLTPRWVVHLYLLGTGVADDTTLPHDAPRSSTAPAGIGDAGGDTPLPALRRWCNGGFCRGLLVSNVGDGCKPFDGRHHLLDNNGMMLTSAPSIRLLASFICLLRRPLTQWGNGCGWALDEYETVIHQPVHRHIHVNIILPRKAAG